MYKDYLNHNIISLFPNRMQFNYLFTESMQYNYELKRPLSLF